MFSPQSTLYLDRQNFGLSHKRLLHTLFKWKLIDAAYAIILIVLDLTVVHSAHPYERQFTINDITISHPFTEHERVTVQTLAIILVTVPIGVMLLFNMAFTPKGRKLYVFYISFIGLLVCGATCDLIVNTLKNWVGRCRPDFLARCIPRDDALPDHLYFARDVCTTDNVERLLDGFRTTPSGHSSMSFSCLGYLTFWLLGQTLGCSCNYVGAWRFLASLLPTLLAAFVAMSRTQDYRHHFVDVSLGALIGWLMAWWAYRRYFPSVFNKNSYVPSIILDIAEKGPDDYKTHDFYETHSNDDGSWQSNDIESQRELNPFN